MFDKHWVQTCFQSFIKVHLGLKTYIWRNEVKGCKSSSRVDNAKIRFFCEKWRFLSEKYRIQVLMFRRVGSDGLLLVFVFGICIVREALIGKNKIG